MQDVVSSVRRVSNFIKEISNASNEQSSGIDQTNIAVLSMDNVTQQNAALAEEASAFTFAIARPLFFFSQLNFNRRPIDNNKNISRSIYGVSAYRRSYTVENLD